MITQPRSACACRRPQRNSSPEPLAFYADILRCADGSYHVGHTDDIEQRIAQHQSGALGGYTARRRPVALVWTQMFTTRDDAFAAERKLKGWSRAKKKALIAGDWTLISHLARGRTGRKPDTEVSVGPSTSSG